MYFVNWREDIAVCLYCIEVLRDTWISGRRRGIRI